MPKTMTLNLRSVAIRRGRGGYGFTVYGEAPCRIGWISKASSCESVGLREGDSIMSVNGENVFAACHSYVVQLIGLSAEILHLELKDEATGSMSSQLSLDEDFKSFKYSEVDEMQLHHHTKEKGLDSRRTELVLNELKDGTLLQNMLYADLRSINNELDTGSLAQDFNAVNDILSYELTAHKVLGFEGAYSSNSVFLKSVVAYLGSVETMVDDFSEIPHFCITAIETCVAQLRREQHIHQRVVMRISRSSVKLVSADGDIVAVYDRQQIYFSTSCPSDERFFCIATLNPKNQVQCHQFMVDPEMSKHSNHAERAKRFAIHCSTELETGHCIEFPQSSRVILKMVETLFHSQAISSSLHHMESSTHYLKDENMNGNATNYIPADMTDSKMFDRSIDQQQRVNNVKKEFMSLTLSKQNLKQHEINSSEFTNGADFNRYLDSATEFYNIMHRISPGKHKRGGRAGTLPLKSSTSLLREGSNPQDINIRQSKRGNKGNKSNEGSFFRIPKRSSSRQLKLNMKNMMSKSSESIQRSESAHLSGASSIESLSSNASLPSSFYGSAITNLENAGRIAQWAMSFDKLLEDDLGIKYFTEFLRKEFSQENILFWLDCQKLRKIPPSDIVALKELADKIYEKYLSDQATSPVNIDSKGQRMSDEALLKPPYPDMFLQQQNQIYKLMKLDSYSRFLKSPLYYQCLHRQADDLPLPVEANAQKDSRNETSIESRHSFSLKSRRFFPKKNRKVNGSNTLIHRDSSDSEPRFLDASAKPNLPDDTASMHEVGADASLICRLVLWDGTSTVLYAEEGKATIRDALNTLCERRNIPLSAVDIYYQNEDRALALDQDVAVLAGQEVRVERRTLFRLDLLPMGRSVGVKAKPTKSIEEVLKPVVSKYGLDLESLQSRINGRNELLDLSTTVNILDGLRVNVSHAADKKEGGDSLKKSNSREKSQLPGKSDMDDLINVMSVAQNGKMHDQRGLLSEMNLELPDFLKTSSSPSTAKSIALPRVESNKNQNNNNRHLEYPITARVDDQLLDVPVTKFATLPVNHVETGNVKTKMQKLWHPETDTKYSPNISLSTSDTFRKKIPSIDADPSNNKECESVTLSSVDDDPYMITKWMQSISCTPNYPYTLNLNDTFELSPGVSDLNIASSKGAFFDIESSHSTDEPSIAHDHRYTKRKEKA